MGSFPPSIVPPPGGGGGATPPGPAAPAGNASPLIMLANLGTIISGLSKQFPGADQGIKMMMDGLRQVQASVQAQSVPQQSAAPPM